MKQQYLLNETDLVSETGIDLNALTRLVNAGIVFPAQKTPVLLFFSRDIDKVRHVKTMLDLGYSVEEIKKIAKDVGLPHRPDSEKRDKLYSIGEFCEKFDLNPRQIKYWESLGLFFPAMRSKGGVRLYSEDLLVHIRFILHLQELGFKLEDIKDIIKNNNADIVESRLNHLSDIIRDIRPILKNMKKLK